MAAGRSDEDIAPAIPDVAHNARGTLRSPLNWSGYPDHTSAIPESASRHSERTQMGGLTRQIPSRPSVTARTTAPVKLSLVNIHAKTTLTEPA